MKNFANLLKDNRTTTTAMKRENFEVLFTDNAKERFVNWKSDVEALRLAVSDYAVANRTNAPEDVLKETRSDVFSAYKKVLAWLTDKSIDQKLAPQGTDLESLLTFIGANRKAKDSDNGRDFMPVGATTFRKSLEDFISDRLTARSCMTAADIEQEKAKKKAEKKAREAARKAAEKVNSEFVAA